MEGQTHFDLVKSAVEEFISIHGDTHCKNHLVFDIHCSTCCFSMAEAITLGALTAQEFKVKQAWINLAIQVGERGEELVFYYQNLMQN